jgi:hypothetical protein
MISVWTAFLFVDVVAFLFLAQQPSWGPDHLIADVSKSHLDLHCRQDSSGRLISPSQRPLPAQHTSNARDERPHLQRIRTRDRSRQADSDLRLKHRAATGIGGDNWRAWLWLWINRSEVVNFNDKLGNAHALCILLVGLCLRQCVRPLGGAMFTL